MKRWRIAFWSAGAFTALAIVVHLGLLDGLDTTLRGWARPGDVWGTAQLRADLVVEGLRPVVVAVLLATFTLVYSARRRSLRAVAFIGGVGLVTIALTIASKITVGRLNTHAVLGSNGGSFPSGHVISVVVCLGLLVLIVQPRTRWWIWLIPAFGGVVMGASLLLQAAHWFTDVVGGGLLAITILAATSACTDWMHSRFRNDHDYAASEQRNVTLLTPVSNGDISIAPLNNEVPASTHTDCYDPGRGTFTLRSCGGV
jgi:membrane-associated phospholipid phosphatase